MMCHLIYLEKEIPRFKARSKATSGKLHGYWDCSLENIQHISRFNLIDSLFSTIISRPGLGRCWRGLLLFINNRDEDTAFPVTAVKFGFLCGSILDETAPVV